MYEVSGEYVVFLSSIIEDNIGVEASLFQGFVQIVNNKCKVDENSEWTVMDYLISPETTKDEFVSFL